MGSVIIGKRTHVHNGAAVAFFSLVKHTMYGSYAITSEGCCIFYSSTLICVLDKWKRL